MYLPCLPVKAEEEDWENEELRAIEGLEGGKSQEGLRLDNNMLATNNIFTADIS